MSVRHSRMYDHKQSVDHLPELLLLAQARLTLVRGVWKTDMKEGHAERITSVMPAAGEIGNGNLDPQLTLGTAEEGKPGEPTPVSLSLSGVACVLLCGH